jgi:hypothetical protein
MMIGISTIEAREPCLVARPTTPAVGSAPGCRSSSRLSASMADAAAASQPPPRITRISVAGSRTIEAQTFFERTYTVYSIEGGVGGPNSPPVKSERRFAEVADFHAVWCEPLMSPDRPVFLPPKEPVSFVMKNDADLVAGRIVAIRKRLPQTIPPRLCSASPSLSRARPAKGRVGSTRLAD